MNAIDPLLHESKDKSKDNGSDDISQIDVGNQKTDNGADKHIEEEDEEELKKKLSIHGSRHLFRSISHRGIYPNRIPQDHPSFRPIR